MSGSDMITCRDAVEKLWAYIDGELPEAEAGQVHDHLELCRACYPHYDFQRAFCEFVRQHTRRPVPAGLRRRVFMALLEEEAGAGSGGSS